MRIFVTGATGFIGRAFCRKAVSRGHRILALTRDPNAQIAAGIETAVGSLAEIPVDQIRRFSPEVLLHLAWITDPGHYLNSIDNETWLEQSRILFRNLIELGTESIVGTGTCIEYSPSEEPLHEIKSPLGPRFPYSKAKFDLLKWLEKQNGIDWAWFRVFYPYGVGEHPDRLISNMIRQLLNGSPIVLRTPDSIKDYIHVDDVANAFCLAIERRTTGVLNVGTGRGVRIQEIANQISRILKADASLIQRAETRVEEPYPIVVADVSRLHSIGWRPHISLDAGLESLVEAVSLSS